MENLITKIKRHESFSSMPYIDPIVDVDEKFKKEYGKKLSSLNLTIGYGTKLGISKEEAEWLLKHRLKGMVFKVDYRLKLEDINVSDNVKQALYNMAYNLGVDGLFKFKKMLQALKDKNYELASKEALDSKWAKEVGSRATEIAGIIRKG